MRPALEALESRITPAYLNASPANVIFANSQSVTLSGGFFDTNPANDIVTFTNNVTGTVTSATGSYGSQATVHINGLGNVIGGNELTASLTVDGALASGSPAQIGTVTQVVTPNMANVNAVTATNITIAGFGFDSNAANDTVTFDNGVSGTVAAATSTTLTVHVIGLTSLPPNTALNVTSTSVDGYSNSSVVEVANVVGGTPPSITSSTAAVADSSATITINGAGFGTASVDTVVFTLGVTGTVLTATNTQLTVSVTSPPTALGVLDATLTVGSTSTSTVAVATEVNGNFVVTDNGGGAGSFADITLPYAVATALNGDVVSFASSLSTSTISLNATLDVNTNITITGLGANELSISGQNQYNGFSISPGVTATITDLTVTSASSHHTGGAIVNGGTLTLERVTLTNSYCYYSGGGVLNQGVLTIYDSTLSDNTVLFNGGGIANFGTMTVTNTTIDDNAYYTFGGGIYNFVTGTMTLSNSTITGNSAIDGAGLLGGGIFNSGQASIYDSIIAGNVGSFSGPDFCANGQSFGANYGAPAGATATSAPINVLSDSIIGDSTDLTYATGSHNQLGVNPLLASNPAYNGGPTETIALLPGSPAIFTALPITTVSSSIGLTDTTIHVVNAATIAQTQGNYTITIGSEDMLVTNVNVAANTLTVQRGYLGTTPETYAVGTGVRFSADQRGVPSQLPSIGAYGPSIAILVVTDPGSGAGSASDVTLPYAVSTADADSGGVIEFAASLSGHTITLNSTLTLSGDITILGLGASSLAVSGNHNVAVFSLPSDSVVAIENLTIENGAGANGAAINNAGVLTLVDSVVTGSTATANGGGIFNSGTLVLTADSVTGNSAVNGGGIFNTGQLSLIDGTVSGNHASASGSGIDSSGSLTISTDSATATSTISDNIVSQSAGITLAGSGTLTISGNISLVTTASPAQLGLGGSGPINISGNINLGSHGTLTDSTSGSDTISGVITSSGATSSQVQGLIGTYFDLTNASSSLISPANSSNASWLGNQSPVATAPLVGPIDFLSIGTEGFRDVNGNTYYDPANGANNINYVEARWTGNITIPGTGTTPVPIDFYSNSDDGNALYIDGTMIVQTGVGHASAIAMLTPGVHTIDDEYYQVTGGGDVTLEWDVTGGTNFVDIPNSAFSYSSVLGGVTMVGPGSLTLSNVNQYVGPTVIDGGAIVVTSNGATGPTTASGIIVNNGGSLDLSGGFNYNDAEPITITGAGANGAGAIDNISGNNTVSIVPTITGSGSLGAVAGTTLTFTTPLSLTASETFAVAGAGTVILSGNITVSPGTASLSNVGTGLLDVTGNISLSAGSGSVATTFTLGGGGTIDVSGNISLGSQGVLKDNTTGNDTITGLISSTGTSNGLVQGALVGTYFNIPYATAQLQPAAVSNASWLGNQTPAVTAQLVGPIDFPDIAANGFVDNAGGPTYYDIPGNNNNVEARWYGDIMIPGAGTTPIPIDFATTSDDGSTLYVDGTEVVNNDYDQGATQRTGVINLTPGLHQIDIEYFQGGGGASMVASWDPTGNNNFSVIPISAFYTSNPVGGVTMGGTGSLTLSPVVAGGNTYQGPTIINAGSLVVTTNHATGTGTAATITVNKGGSFGLAGGIDYTNTQLLTINGPGTQNNGAVESFSGINTLAIVPVLGTAPSIGAVAGATLIYAPPLSLASGQTFLVEGAGTTNITSTVTISQGTATLDMTGTGLLEVTGNVVLSPSAMSANALGLALAGSGAINISGNISLGSQGILTDSTSGSDTISGVISGSGSSTVLASGLVGQYFDLANAAPNMVAQGSGTPPTLQSNPAWLGNQTPAVTANLVGPIDFQSVGSIGFEDSQGNSYYTLTTTPAIPPYTSPPNDGNIDNIEARWYGDITIPGTGTTPVPIDFYTNSDDNNDLYIDGTLVVHSDVSQASAIVMLTPGVHTIDDDYIQQTGGGDVDLQWDPTGGTAFVDIPNSVFSHSVSLGGVTMSGSASGSLTLTNVNAYTGPTIINTGSLVVTVNGATANSTITVNNGGSFGLAGGIDYTSTVPTISGNGANGNGAIENFSGNNTLGIPIALTTSAAIGSRSGTLTVIDPISGGTSALVLDGSGTTNVAAGITVGAAGLELLGSGTINISGNVSLGAQGSLNAEESGSATITGVISGTGTGTANDLIMAGSGTLTLAKTNTYLGTTTISNGTLIVTADGATGSGTAAGILVGSGGALGFSGGLNYNTGESITVNGTGPGGLGAIVNLSGNNTFTSAIVLGASATIGSDAGLLTLTGGITMGSLGNITFTGSGNTTETGVITGTYSSYFNATSISGLQYELDASNSSSLVTNGSGGVTQWNDLSGNGNNFTDAAYTTVGNNLSTGVLNTDPGLVSGEIDGLPALQFYGSARPTQLTGAANVNVQTVILVMVVSADNSGDDGVWGQATPNADNDNSLRLGGSGSSIYFHTQLPTGSSGISDANGSDFVDSSTPTGTTYITTPTSADQNTGAIPTGSPFIVEATGDYTPPLTEIGGGSYQDRWLNGYVGEVLAYSTQLTTTQRQDVEDYLSDEWFGTDYGAGGSGNLQKTGTGTLTLSNTNTYSGSTTIKGGTLNVTANGAMGPATSQGITVDSGGTLAFSGGVNYTDAEPVSISGSGSAGVGAIENISGGNTFAGAITLTGNATVGSAAGTLNLAGPIQGVGFGLTVVGTGTGTVALSDATNTYTGATTVNSGTLLLTGGLADTSGVTVNTGGTLAGTGSASAALVVTGGVVNPSNPLNTPGTLKVSSANFASLGNLTADISSSANSVLNVTGALTLGGTSTLSLNLAGLTLSQSTTYTISTDGSVSGQFAGLYLYNNTNDYQAVVSYTSTAVKVTLTPPTAATATIEADTGSNPSQLNAPATFTVSVTNPLSTAGQTVQIEDASNGDAIVATPTLTNGSATFSITSLGVGSHNLFAVYTRPGGISYSNLVTQVVMTPLVVNSVTATSSGFVLLFNEPINPSSTVLYSSPGDTTLGAADISVVGATSGTLRGSLVIDPTNPDEATFVQTSGLLAPDTYTVTVTNKVTGVAGNQLTANFSTPVVVAATTTPVLSVPSFARGPGQTVALNDTLGDLPATGIPVNISSATNVTSASFTLTYNPTLLTIAPTGALVLSSAATAAGITTVSYTITAGADADHSTLTVTLSSSGTGTGLTTTAPETLLTILASVPATATYIDKAVLGLAGGVTVNGSPGAGVSGVQVVAYLGDVLGTGLANATGASLVDQVASGAGTGFSAFKDLDPVIVGGVEGGLFVNATDASLINEAAAGQSIPQIPSVPTLPSGVTLAFGGPDPYLYLSAVQGAPGQTVTETLYLDVTDPNGIQLTALDEAIGFAAGALHISNVRSAAGLAGLGSYNTADAVDNSTGVLLVGQAFEGIGLPPLVPYGTDVAVLQFDVTLSADATPGEVSGLTLLQDGSVNGQLKYTAISDNEGALTFTPGKAPSNSGNAAIDGTVTVVTTPAAAEVVVTEQRSTVVQSKTSDPVRRVTSGSQPTQTTGILVNSQVSVVTIEETIPVITVVTPSSAETSVTTATITVSVNDSPASLSAANTLSSGTKVVDPGVSLSLVALGSNKAAYVAPTSMSTAQTPTSALDQLYGQLNTASVNGFNLIVGGEETPYDLVDLWDLDNILEEGDQR